MNLTWVEFSKSAFIHNLHTFKQLVGSQVVLAPNVKGNAYGHGLVECAQILEKEKVDYMCLNALYEAEKLRSAGITTPLFIGAYVALDDLERAIELKTEFIVYNLATLKKLIELKKEVSIHLKIETGNHRQGIEIDELRDHWIPLLKKQTFVNIKGVCTHFANIEDRINVEYGLYQLNRFNEAVELLEKNNIKPLLKHCASSASLLMFPEAHFNMGRLGIGIYGLWPSHKTRIATKRLKGPIELKPALSWKTVVAQVKSIKKGAKIGYGCTYEMKKEGRIAILPVGYYDGYARRHSNQGYVLIKGEKAPVVGRICMNMMMVDISHIENAQQEEEVILMGSQGKRTITADMLAEWSGTINYEVTTRINERIERIIVD